MNSFMKVQLVIRAMGVIALLAVATLQAEVIYTNDFEKAELGSVPEDFLVLEGQFSVKEKDANKVLELPFGPLDSFGFLFGPKEMENVSVQARIFASAKGRRFPVFEVGLNGLGGYKLRVAPAKKQLELYRGNVQKAAVPLKWTSGKWTRLDLRVLKAGEAEWKVEGKVWQDGSEKPKEPMIVFVDKQAPTRERASIGATPFSGEPIYFDDLAVSTVAR